MIRRIFLLSCLVAAFLGVALNAARADTPANTASEQRILVMLDLGPDHYRPSTDYGGSYSDALGRSARRRLAKHIAKKNGLTLGESWPMPLIGVDCVVMILPAGRSSETVVAALSQTNGVAWAQPMHEYKSQSSNQATHNDKLFLAQPAVQLWQLGALHKRATGRGVTVAVIDSQIDLKHPDLQGQVSSSDNFVDSHTAVAEAHGTAVAGIIAARADNAVGIAGIAPNARLLNLRACWEKPNQPSATVCDSLSLAKAMTSAIERKARVVNLSLSGPQDPLLAKLISISLARHMTLVAAVDPARADGGFPASQHGVIAVSDQPLATARQKVYIAPGTNIPTTEPGERWTLVTGSSFAAAHVSGLMALVRQLETSNTSLALPLVTDGGVIDACSTLHHVAPHDTQLCGQAPAGSSLAIH
jgi:subtilisin family serine protease